VIRLTNAHFVKSASRLDQSTPESISEVAFVGRSNVGKSSIINALTSKKGLAKSSSTPGKTRLINFFHVTFLKDEASYEAQLVDLPGFGYARVSKSMKAEWQHNLTEYIRKRLSIRLFVHLVDGRHPLLEIDKEVHDYLQSIVRPDQAIVRIFTKADKLSQSEISLIKKNYPHAVLVSNTSKKGIEKAQSLIFEHLFGVVA
jgi:GTP-binding protein